jgi:ERF superfamily
MTDRKVYEPDELKELLDDAEVPADDRPRYLLPLHLLLPLLKREIGPIGKSGQMKAQVKDGEKKGPEYKFRQIEDILNEGHGPLVALGISWRKVEVVDHKLTANGKAQECVIRVRYEIVGPLGDSMLTEAVGQAVDFGSDKATNKADTSARKNMLVDLLQLATEDPDTERPERVDERPHVQRVSVAQFTEVADAIKALPETERERVKEWAAERGMVVKASALTRGDLAQLKPFVASRAKEAAALTQLGQASGDPGNLTDVGRAASRAPTDLVTKDDTAYLSTVMAELTPDEREAIKVRRTALGLSLQPGKFTVATLGWLVEEAQKAIAARGNGSAAEVVERMAGALPKMAEEKAQERDAGQARRAAGGAKLATRTERDAVAAKLAELSPEIRAEVEAWAESAGHRLGDQLAASSYRPVMRSISGFSRTSRLKQRTAVQTPAPGPEASVPAEQPAVDPEAPRRALRREQWATLTAAAEALGAEQTWAMVHEELTAAGLTTKAMAQAQVALTFCAADGQWDDFLAEMVAQYKEVADEFLGKPFEPAHVGPSGEAASDMVSGNGTGLDDLDY